METRFCDVINQIKYDVLIVKINYIVINCKWLSIIIAIDITDDIVTLH